MMSKNTELQQRRVDAVARGVGNATQLFAVRAENAEIWDADGRRYIDFSTQTPYASIRLRSVSASNGNDSAYLSANLR